MKLLEERIMNDGKVLPGNVLKVDNFVNHQIDVPFINELGKEFFRLYKDCGVNKILTVEASGIGIACLTAQFFNAPVVFAKKSKSSNIPDDCYTCTVKSFTRNKNYDILVNKKYLSENDTVLIIDDFLAHGNALKGLIEICNKAGCKIAGAGIVIEKAFQSGGNDVRAMGYRVESLARVKSMSPENGIIFTD